LEKLRLRDIFENDNLGGYEKLYPPLKVGTKDINEYLMNYYK